ncbi:MAG: beta-N-acetylhexosaminidase [Actinobacteria bacterium 13_1_20CM_3_71_11]|nr:MAG: beta-N-acetylhexosaminidase [Actinobacteria bacterium 13_1_20CM_3_71_11]
MRVRRVVAVSLSLVLAGGALSVAAPAGAAVSTGFAAVVPAPVSAAASGAGYGITSATTIATDSAPVGQYLAAILRRSTGYPLPVKTPSGGSAGIALLLSGAPAQVGDEGYTLDVTGSGVVIRARKAAGLFEGVQTLRQLLPSTVESRTVKPGPWPVPGGHVLDYPRFAYRGAMLDVARHFFTVAQVERYLDEIALYKVNRFHLHLSDDQGWRIAITGWERLASYGGGTEVGGGPGGFYTQDDYKAIVAYAQQRFITVVPEIDMPGHTNAALASYAQLNCDGKAPPRYTGTDVGFSSLCVSKDITYTFIDAVFGQLAALTPGPYLHIGGDEAQSTKPADYAKFINRVQQIVAGHGKAVLGWHDIVNATPLPSTVAEFWDTSTSNPAVAAAAKHGTKLVLAPANHAYLDMKYTTSTKLGQNWAGYTEVNKAYGWDPGAYVSGVPSSAVLGVEAPLWTETIVTNADIDYMAFPRLPAIAELGWSPHSTHNWTAFRNRLAAQGPRWKVMKLAYYHSPQIPWPSGS